MTCLSVPKEYIECVENPIREDAFDISEEEKQLIVDFEEGAEGDNPDLAMRNPIFAKFEADKMLLSNYDEIEEMERMLNEYCKKFNEIDSQIQSEYG